MTSYKSKINILKNWINKRANLLLFIGIGLYCSIFVIISYWKYNHFGYNALDLAIFNQVFYNTSLGDFFSFTIHPHSYLGDHFGLFLVLLLPFYYLFRHPFTLLILQTFAIGFSAWPLYLIVKKIASRNLALLISFVFLLCPFVQNINLFEFHLIPFAIFFIFFLFYFYLSGRFPAFLVFSLLALTIREDVALVIIMFSVLAFLDKRQKKWIIAPFFLGLAWLTIALLLIPIFSNYESYKFLFYYSWLGNSMGNIILNFFLHPLKVLFHIFSIKHIVFILALFLPFLLLPLLKPKYLILALLAFLQILLGGFTGELILKTHYSSLILPFVFIALSSSFLFLLDKKSKGKFHWQFKLKMLVKKDLVLLFVIFSAVTLYSTFTFGPLLPFFRNLFSSKIKQEYVHLKNNYLKFIPDDNSVTASYDFLPKLSGRKNIFSFHYAFVGKKQYSFEPYLLPETEYLLLDTNDFLIFQVQYPPDSFYRNAYSEGDNRIRSIIQEQNLKLAKASDSILLYKRGNRDKITPYNILDELPNIQNPKDIKAAPKIKFLGWDYQNVTETNNPTFELPFAILPVSLYWQSQISQSENFQLSLEIINSKNKTIYQKYYPLAYGIYPSSEWKPNEIVKTNYWFLVPASIPVTNSSALLKLVRLTKDRSYLGLDGLLSATMKNVEYEEVGGKITIPLLNS